MNSANRGYLLLHQPRVSGLKHAINPGNIPSPDVLVPLPPWWWGPGIPADHFYEDVTPHIVHFSEDVTPHIVHLSKSWKLNHPFVVEASPWPATGCHFVGHKGQWPDAVPPFLAGGSNSSDVSR